MTKLAIDVVLLPPDEIMDIAIDLNRRFDPAFELNKVNRFPHITLFQFIVDQDNLVEVSDRLKKISKTFSPIKLVGKTEIHPGAFLSTKETSDFTFPNSDSIHDLHVDIVNKLKDIVSFDAEPECFYDSAVRQESVNWVRNFLQNASFDKFQPHITIGAKNATKPSVSVEFKADRLAICQLGDYNTCRKILYETKLT